MSGFAGRKMVFASRVFGYILPKRTNWGEIDAFVDCGVGFAALVLAAARAQAQKPEKAKVHLGVGGKTSLYYLPLTVTEKLGYFKEAGLEVEISDFQGGASSLQALMGGSVDVVTGSFDHTIQIQAKGQQHRRAGADGPLSGLRARAAQGEGRRLQEPEGPQGHEDRRHRAGIEHALHGALHDGAGRAKAGRRGRSSAPAPATP